MWVKIIKLRALQLHDFTWRHVCVMYAICQIPFKEGSQKSQAPSRSFYLDLPFSRTSHIQGWSSHTSPDFAIQDGSGSGKNK